MKLLVVSDTHGDVGPVLQIFGRDKVDLILHAGDHFQDGVKLAAMVGIPVVAVTGNCDPPWAGPAEELLAVAGKNIFITHGHFYGVKSGVSSLVERARELKADVVIFGHTHRAVEAREQGILIMNPGSITRPRSTAGPSYGLIEINGPNISSEIIYLPGLEKF